MPPATLDPPQCERVTLYYRQGSSDKVYQAAIEPRGPGFVVNFAFGRRGSTLQSGSKTVSPVGYDQAKKLFDKLVHQKTAKGYTPGEDGTPYRSTDHQQRCTGILPQLLNPIDEDELDKYLGNDLWWMQEKFDGKRLLIRKAGRQVAAINRKGLTVGLPQTIAAAVLLIHTQHCLLDGEAVGEVFHAFDLLERNDLDFRPNSYATRYENLKDLIDPVASSHLFYAPSATDAGEKAYMLQNLRQRKREGVVFKDRTAPYTPGRPNSGGSQVKLKFYATVSCIVAGNNGTKRSIALELFEGVKRIGVGNVTIPPNVPIPRVGEVVEVRYLYAYPGGSLYQPVYLGVRDDIRPESCSIKELKLKSDNSEES